MNVFIIAGIVGVSVILFGIMIASLFTRLSTVVADSQGKQEKEKTAYNPAVTMGYRIPVKGSQDDQLKAARQAAAKQAAGQARYGNMGVGQGSDLKTASQGLSQDPITAVKIANYHTWQGARSGIPAGAAAAVAAGPAVVARPTAPPALKTAEDLIPGRDYPFIAITDSMSPDEKRKATIANSKARSAAIKALKQSGVAEEAAGEVAVAATPLAAAPVVATTTAEVPAGEINLVPGVDYAYIAITDSMSPDEKRKATIANSKARSAAMKAAKERGVMAAPAVETVVVAPPPPPPSAPAGSSPNVASLAGIPKLELIPITDGMSPEDKRKATIANSKARSAYNKALKEAGIDPTTV